MKVFADGHSRWFSLGFASAGLLAAWGCAPRPAPSRVATSICQRYDVLDFATAHYQATNLYLRPASLQPAETPTLYPDTVLCTVRVEVGHYDTARDGARPQVRLEERSFYVTKLGYGFRIRFAEG